MGSDVVFGSLTFSWCMVYLEEQEEHYRLRFWGQYRKCRYCISSHFASGLGFYTVPFTTSELDGSYPLMFLFGFYHHRTRKAVVLYVLGAPLARALSIPPLQQLASEILLQLGTRQSCKRLTQYIHKINQDNPDYSCLYCWACFPESPAGKPVCRSCCGRRDLPQSLFLVALPSQVMSTPGQATEQTLEVASKTLKTLRGGCRRNSANYLHTIASRNFCKPLFPSRIQSTVLGFEAVQLRICLVQKWIWPLQLRFWKAATGDVCLGR